MLGIGDASWSNWGYPRWQLVLCLALGWIIAFLCLIKGIKSAGKVIYFTALFPFVILTALLVSGGCFWLSTIELMRPFFLFLSRLGVARYRVPLTALCFTFSRNGQALLNRRCGVTQPHRYSTRLVWPRALWSASLLTVEYD